MQDGHKLTHVLAHFRLSVAVGSKLYQAQIPNSANSQSNKILNHYNENSEQTEKKKSIFSMS